MLDQNFKSQLIIDLTTEEQEILAAGQAAQTPPTPPAWNSMPSMLPSILGRGFPNPANSQLGGTGMGQGEEIVNAQGNDSGVVLY